MTTTITLSADEYDALLAERERLVQQLRCHNGRTDLLKERLDAFLRRFSRPSPSSGESAQRDLFLNEAEALARWDACRRGNDTRRG